MAGRSMPGRVFSENFDIAIRAPVLPAETTALASPLATASMAMPHAGAPALAQNGRGLVVRTDDLVGMPDLRNRLQARMLVQERPDLGLVAEIRYGRPEIWRTRAAPATTMSGASSPPIPSSAMTSGCGNPLSVAYRLQARTAMDVKRPACFDDFPAFVVPARSANMVRPRQLAAIGALHICPGIQRGRATCAHRGATGSPFSRNRHLRSDLQS